MKNEVRRCIFNNTVNILNKSYMFFLHIKTMDYSEINIYLCINIDSMISNHITSEFIALREFNMHNKANISGN